MASVACVIPALDAAATLGALAGRLRVALPRAIIVAVDDGSADATSDVARESCDLLLRFPVNRGKGAALRAGISAALERGVEAVVTIDADGQHPPEAAPSLLAALARADIAIGARSRQGGAMPLGRRMTNALASAAVGAIIGHDISDSQSGFRAIRRAVLESVTARGDRYEYETDFLIQAGRAGFHIEAVPIATVYGAPSHFRAFRDSTRVVRTIWRHRAGAFR
ncbi:MAG TPA: glycosyltransferase family 2 protein [Gemmatimonadaceae bacterium]|jgi:glycosyltransferase involved in cell wall biosynthesis|nr:glycosyltransferase family 2 protein [Gemmatimonadaceae bacterium]